MDIADWFALAARTPFMLPTLNTRKEKEDDGWAIMVVSRIP